MKWGGRGKWEEEGKGADKEKAESAVKGKGRKED